MPRNIKEKKKKIETLLSNHDILHIFNDDKYKDVAGPNLKLSEDKFGCIVLSFRRTSISKWDILAIRGTIKSQVTGWNRRVILLDPKVSDPTFIRAIIASTDPGNVYWIYKFIPLNEEKALSIWEEANASGIFKQGAGKSDGDIEEIL